MMMSDAGGRLSTRTVDKASVIPLYYQLRTILLQRIEDRTLRVGDSVPSERELEQQYGLSRTTVRQAINSLVVDGYLERDRGRGTFVAMPKLRRPLLGLTGFSESMRSLGYAPSSRVLGISRENPTKRLAEVLQVPEDQFVLRVYRIRLADEIPIGLHTVYLPLARGIEVDELDLAEAGNSLYAALLSKYGLAPIEAEDSIEATVASDEEALLLCVTAGAPLLLVQRITYDEAGLPFEFSKALYRGDRYQYYMRVRR